MQMIVLAGGLLALAAMLFLLIYKIAAQLRVRRAARAAPVVAAPDSASAAAVAEPAPAPERRRRVGGAGLVSADDPSRPALPEPVLAEPEVAEVEVAEPEVVEVEVPEVEGDEPETAALEPLDWDDWDAPAEPAVEPEQAEMPAQALTHSYAEVEAALEDAFARLEGETISLADYTAEVEVVQARVAAAEGMEPDERAAAAEAIEWCLDWARQLASGDRAAA